MSLSYTKNRLARHDTGLVAFDDNIFTPARHLPVHALHLRPRARRLHHARLERARRSSSSAGRRTPAPRFYVGYNDDLNRNGFNPFTGDLEPGFRRNGRTFFIKMSYLFRRSL